MRDRHVVGTRLRALRIARQMRQVDLAVRAKVRPNYLCSIEADASYCGDLLAARLADALGVGVDEFTEPGPHPNLPTWRSHNRRRAA